MTVDSSSILPDRPSPGPTVVPHRAAGTPGPIGLPDVPGYVLLSVLGRGGMGVVYKARDTRLHRDVALKMLTAGAFADPVEQQRFRAEAEAIAALQHPNIVQVYEIGEAAGLPFFAMEYVEGGSLHHFMAGQPLPPRRAAEIAVQLAHALHHAHQRDIIHRDIKPANILLDKVNSQVPVISNNQELNFNRKPVNSKNQEPNSNKHRDWNLALGSWNLPKVSDFGLAKRLDGAGSGVRTETGTALGTPNYMAPEQATGRRDTLGPAVDVYALGAVLYEMLIGRPPFLGSDAIDILLLVRTAEPVAPRKLRATVPRDLETICLKCLQKQPARRYATAAELADDLERYLVGEPIKARPVGPLERAWKWARRRPAIAALTAAVVLISLAGLSGVLWQWRLANQRQAEAVQAREATEATLYESRIAQTALLWERNSAPRALELIERTAAKRPGLRHWEWRFLASLLRRRLGEADNAGTGQRLAISPDGRRVVATSLLADHLPPAARRGVFHIFNADLTETVNRVEQTAGFAAAVAGADHRFVTAGYDGVVRVWDGQGREQFRLDDWGNLDVTRDGLFAAERNLALSPDGRWLARWRDDRSVEVRDLSTNSVTARLTGHAERLKSLRFRADGRQLVTNGTDGTLRVWDVATGREHRRFSTAGGFAEFAISPDGRWLAVVLGGEPGVRVRESDTGRDVLVLPTLDRVWGLQFSPDGGYLVAALGVTRLQVWAVPSGVGYPVAAHAGGVSAWAIGPDGATLATGGFDGEIRLGNLADGTGERVYRGHGSFVKAVQFSPDGLRVYSSDLTGRVFAWDATRDAVADKINHPQSAEWCADLQFAPDGQDVRVLGVRGATGYDPATGLRRWDRPLPLWPVARYPRSDGTFSPDGQFIYGVPADDTAAVAAWKLADGTEVRRFTGSVAPVKAVAVSPDGQWLAATTFRINGAGETVIWRTADGVEVHRIARAASALAFDHRGRLALAVIDATNMGDRRRPHGKGFALFDPATAVLTPLPLPGEPPYCTGLAFSADGTILAAALFDRDVDNVAVWDVNRHALRFQLTTGDSAVRAAFSPDGRRLAVNGYSARVSLWDAETGGNVLTLPQSQQRHSDYAFTAAVAFSPDGRRLAALAPGGIYVWDAGPPGESADQLRARLRAEADAAAPLRSIDAAYRHIHSGHARRFYVNRIGDPDRLPAEVQADYGRLMVACGDWAAARRAFDRGAGTDWQARAAVAVLAGGRGEYQRFCAALPERLPGLSESDQLRVELQARTLAPGGGSPERLRQLLARCATVAGDEGFRRSLVPMRALAELRLGVIGPAADELERHTRSQRDDLDDTVRSALILTLIRRHEGKLEEAAKWKRKYDNWLAQCPEATRRDGVMPYRYDHRGSLSEWAYLNALAREVGD